MKAKILLVDDNAAFVDSIMDILEDEGYDLFSAGTCTEAIGLAAAHKPQIALLDLKLPDDTGINLLNNIKQVDPDCICAMMTAFADVDSAVCALERGAFHYLQKPVQPIELLNLLERIVETLQTREAKRSAEKRLRESEHRCRTIVESAQDAIFLKDRQLRYTLVNPVMERLFGVPATRLIGRTDEALFGKSDYDHTRIVDQRVLGGQIVEEDETRQLAGKTLILHSIRVPMTDGSGNIVGLCGFSRDLTTTRNLEGQLLRAQKMEAIGTLAGGIAHDFNNLLQAISGYTQMLLIGKSSGDPDFVKLREIDRAARRAGELTARLLAFSRKVDSRLRPVNLNQVVSDVKKLLERTIPKMIDIRLLLSESIGTVSADPGQLEQVILNIGLNARDAMPEGGCLTIETAHVPADQVARAIPAADGRGDYVLLAVNDTGHGMSPDILEHMFEPFFTTKEPGRGTGLGMAMAYGIVQNHHGHITCESLPEKGTTFKIYLPALAIQAEDRVEPPEIAPQRGEGETVLVVDDEFFIRELARDMLSMNGYQVITAETGEEGLAVYRRHMPSIALTILDLIMPGMGGKQCMTEILKINPHAKVLIASGHALDDPTADEVLSKAAGFIQKPYNFKRMLHLIREVIKGSK